MGGLGVEAPALSLDISARRPTARPARVRLDTNDMGTLHYLDQPTTALPHPHTDLSTLHDLSGGPTAPAAERDGEFNSLPVV